MSRGGETEIQQTTMEHKGLTMEKTPLSALFRKDTYPHKTYLPPSDLSNTRDKVMGCTT